VKNWLPKLLSELSAAQRWLLGVGVVLLGMFLLVVPPFQKPDEQTHFFRAIGVAQGNLVCGRDQAGVFQNYIPAYLAQLPDDAYVSHLAFNDEVKFSWKVFLANTSQASEEFTNTPKACTLPFAMYLPMAVVLAVPVWLQADPVIIFYLGRMAQAVVALGLWLLAVKITPKKLRVIPLLMLVIPMVPHQLSSYSKDALHLSAGIVAVAAWLRLVSPVKSVQWRPTQKRIWTLVVLMMAVAVVVLSRPQYIAWLLVPLTVLPAHVHGKVAKKIKASWKWLLVVGLGILVIVGGVVVSLRSEIYSTNAHTVGVITPSLSGIFPLVQFKYVLANLDQAAVVANTTIEEYGLFYLVSMVGQLGWLDNKMYWFVVGGVLGGVVAVTAKLWKEVPQLRWWQQLGLVLVVLGTLAGVFGSFYLYGSPVASPVVEAVQGRYFLLMIPLVIVLITQVRWWPQRGLMIGLSVLLVGSVLAATLNRYYSFDDYYYLATVPQVGLKSLSSEGVWQARLQLEVGKKLRGVSLVPVVASGSAVGGESSLVGIGDNGIAGNKPVVLPYQLLVKDGNCAEVKRAVVIDHRRWYGGGQAGSMANSGGVSGLGARSSKVEVLFPAELVVDSSWCIEVAPYQGLGSGSLDLELQSLPTAEVLYVH
jgi:uncharacterized membrane protein